ncbi:hypothetical protein ATCC90586_003523 [Pythium insidiosum]|nr:hypothetical protein ATCC90586_003523 [Pythium insidiosum]
MRQRHEHEHEPDGVVASLVRKLLHPLERIRERALASLLFKLREGLVGAPQLPLDALLPALLPCLDAPALELSALQVLDLAATRADSADLLAACERHAAIRVLQAAATTRSSDRRAVYDALLRRLLETTPRQPKPLLLLPPATSSRTSSLASSSTSASSSSSAVSVKKQAISASAPLPAHALDAPSAHGWSFAPIELVPVDEQYIFEFEVRCRLRTTVPELVETCDVFRRQLLRDFPPELFLQRPAILMHILQLVQQPLLPVGDQQISIGVNYVDEPSQPTSQSYSWKPSVTAAAAHVACLKAIEALLAALRQSAKTALDPSLQTFASARSAHSIDHALDSTTPRYLYPRVLSASACVDSTAPESGVSLEEAMNRVVGALLSILRWDFPALQLHAMNLIRSALQLASDIATRDATPNDSDCRRIESLLSLVEDVFLHLPGNDYVDVLRESLIQLLTSMYRQNCGNFCSLTSLVMWMAKANAKILFAIV